MTRINPAGDASGGQLAGMPPGWKIVDMKTGKAANRRIPVSLAFLVLAASCAPADEQATPAGMRDEVYVQVMAELMILDANLPAGESVEPLDFLTEPRDHKCKRRRRAQRANGERSGVGRA